jgi:hypothetical protein
MTPVFEPTIMTWLYGTVLRKVNGTATGVLQVLGTTNTGGMETYELTATVTTKEFGTVAMTELGTWDGTLVQSTTTTEESLEMV